jgi:hypothetical protein
MPPITGYRATFHRLHPDHEELVKRAELVLQDVRTALQPLGWRVEGMVAHQPDGLLVLQCDFRFHVSWVGHRRSGREIHLARVLPGPALAGLGPREVERTGLMWAREVLFRAAAWLLEVELPAAGDVDWRPAETIPEDFYAM